MPPTRRNPCQTNCKYHKELHKSGKGSLTLPAGPHSAPQMVRMPWREAGEAATVFIAAPRRAALAAAVVSFGGQSHELLPRVASVAIGNAAFFTGFRRRFSRIPGP